MLQPCGQLNLIENSIYTKKYFNVKLNLTAYSLITSIQHIIAPVFLEMHQNYADVLKALKQLSVKVQIWIIQMRNHKMVTIN